MLPGGVFEREESPGDVPGAGMYLEFYQPRLSCNDARAFGPGEAERLGLDTERSETTAAPGGDRLHDETDPA